MHGANINEKDKDGKNFTRVAFTLLNNHANINEKDQNGKTAIQIAKSNNFIEIAVLLLSNEANINDKGNVRGSNSSKCNI
ncbi:hypothetical protein TVAG_030530 [Trichomonas vaginalis G3]|uniref:Uncharacterized protein n=1 Tax=Trichomonas vaginalis (strain ATCC PRA-98 / G3) TaxID=412133 RepID=A2EY92_TRIV3|nr:Ankyrin repeat family [Trichomonas vaginalis G3]EAY02380.1 hypothetical protein TVAG_030530 [Trichomonas vaginalis G3]KAI5501198.1 Ankyrin repeat family [Trichomonas vaginalis G3]|eukprot:XP_001330641.1 hypothetical protein [Trichomonas vaginalis G3]